MVCGNGDGWGQFGVSQRDGIKAALGERMTACEAAESQPGAFEDAEPDEGGPPAVPGAGERLAGGLELATAFAVPAALDADDGLSRQQAVAAGADAFGRLDGDRQVGRVGTHEGSVPRRDGGR